MPKFVLYLQTKVRKEKSYYEGRSWTKCSTRRFGMAFLRFVVSLRRFVVSAHRYSLSTRCFLRSTRRNASSIRRLVSSVVSSFRRFVVSTRPLREAIIRVHYMKCLPDSMHLYMTRLFIICSVPTENVANGFFEELPTAQHRIRVKASE